MRFLYSFLAFASQFLEAWLCYGFVRLFAADRLKSGFPLVLLSVFLAFSMKGMELLGTDPLISTLWFVFYICVTAAVFFHVDGFCAVSLVSFFILCVYIINFFCISLMGVAAGNQRYASFLLNQISAWRCLYLVINRGLLVFFYIMACRSWGTGKGEAAWFFGPALFGLPGVSFLAWLTLKDITVLTLFGWGLFVTLLILGIFFLRLYSGYLKERREREKMEWREQSSRQEYELLRRHQKEQEHLAHDMRNHFLLLDDLLREGKGEEARAYIGKLWQPMEEIAPSVWTGNYAVDVLLNHLRERCRENEIRLMIQADANVMEFMEAQDVCRLLANLFDNAWEAARKMEKKNRWIRIKIRKAHSMTFLQIVNSSPAVIEEKGGNLKTTKEGAGIHGLGLNSARQAAAAYDGTLEYGGGEGQFWVKVRFLGTKKA